MCGCFGACSSGSSTGALRNVKADICQYVASLPTPINSELTEAVEVAAVIAAAAMLLADAAELAAALAAEPVPVIKAQYPPASLAQTVILQM